MDSLDGVVAATDVVARLWKPVGTAVLAAMLVWMVATGNYTPVSWVMETSVRGFEQSVAPALERLFATVTGAASMEAGGGLNRSSQRGPR